jgi:hypothetical protein
MAFKKEGVMSIAIDHWPAAGSRTTADRLSHAVGGFAGAIEKVSISGLRLAAGVAGTVVPAALVAVGALFGLGRIAATLFTPVFAAIPVDCGSSVYCALQIVTGGS